VASFVDILDTRITARLAINSATYEDTSKHYYLEASNEHGRFEYNFNVALTPAPTKPPYIPGDGDRDGVESEANVGAIVGGVIGILLLLVAITICAVCLYRRK
jgi:hypothetical protein